MTDEAFFAGEVEVTRATEKAILVESTRGKGQPLWVPQSCIHDDSEVWKLGDTGKLVVKQWFAEKQGWAGDRPKQGELPVTQAKCRKCDAPISFVKTDAGKWTPVNPDSTAHWATCPSADDFRKPREARPGEHPVDANGSEV